MTSISNQDTKRLLNFQEAMNDKGYLRSKRQGGFSFRTPAAQFVQGLTGKSAEFITRDYFRQHGFKTSDIDTKVYGKGHSDPGYDLAFSGKDGKKHTVEIKSSHGGAKSIMLEAHRYVWSKKQHRVVASNHPFAKLPDYFVFVNTHDDINNAEVSKLFHQPYDKRHGFNCNNRRLLGAYKYDQPNLGQDHADLSHIFAHNPEGKVMGIISKKDLTKAVKHHRGLVRHGQQIPTAFSHAKMDAPNYDFVFHSVVKNTEYNHKHLLGTQRFGHTVIPDSGFKPDDPSYDKFHSLKPGDDKGYQHYSMPYRNLRNVNKIKHSPESMMKMITKRSGGPVTQQSKMQSRIKQMMNNGMHIKQQQDRQRNAHVAHVHSVVASPSISM